MGLWTLLFLFDPLAQEADALVDRLGAPDIEERWKAAEELRSLGLKAESALERARKSTDPEIRTLAQKLLREIGASSARIEDLRADLIPQNARTARNDLMRRYDPHVRTLLLQAVGSEDLQQAIQSAFILAERGDGALACQTAPSLVARTAAAFFRKETAGYDWVACHVLLRLGPLLSPTELERAYRAALLGVAPMELHERMWQIFYRTLGRLHVPSPKPLIRLYLQKTKERVDRNLIVHIPEFDSTAATLVADRDREVRRYVAKRLLNRGEEVPLFVLVDILDHPPALPRILVHGKDAVPLLEQIAKERDSVRALRAFQGLVQIDREPYASQAIAIARDNLDTDDVPGNAREATKLLYLIGPMSVPILQEALESDDEQASTCAAMVLGGLGILRDLEGIPLRQAARLLGRRADEAECVQQLLLALEPARDRLIETLRDTSPHEARRLQEDVPSGECPPDRPTWWD